MSHQIEIINTTMTYDQFQNEFNEAMQPHHVTDFSLG